MSNEDCGVSRPDPLPTPPPQPQPLPTFHVFVLKQQTYLKVDTRQSNILSDNEKCLLQMGTRFRAEILGVQDNHYELRLKQNISECPQLGWEGRQVFIYAEFVKLDDSTAPIPQPRTTSPTEDWVTLEATQDTNFKLRPIDSAALGNNEKCLVKRGTRIRVQILDRNSNHYHVLVNSTIAGCETLASMGQQGYLYILQAKLVYDNVIVP